MSDEDIISKITAVSKAFFALPTFKTRLSNRATECPLCGDEISIRANDGSITIAEEDHEVAIEEELDFSFFKCENEEVKISYDWICSQAHFKGPNDEYTSFSTFDILVKTGHEDPLFEGDE